MSELTGRRPEFHGQNLFFLGLLGLLATSTKVGAVLARHAGPPRLGPVDVDDDPLLAAALGVVAIRERLLEHVGSALVTPAEPAGAPAGDDPALRALLR